MGEAAGSGLRFWCYGKRKIAGTRPAAGTSSTVSGNSALGESVGNHGRPGGTTMSSPASSPRTVKRSVGAWRAKTGRWQVACTSATNLRTSGTTTPISLNPRTSWAENGVAAGGHASGRRPMHSTILPAGSRTYALRACQFGNSAMRAPATGSSRAARASQSAAASTASAATSKAK